MPKSPYQQNGKEITMCELLSHLEQVLQGARCFGTGHVCLDDAWVILAAIKRQAQYLAMPADARAAFEGTVRGYIRALDDLVLARVVAELPPGEVMESLLRGLWRRVGTEGFAARKWEAR